MKPSRRECLSWAAAGAAGAFLTGCAPVAQHIPHGDASLPLPKGDVHPTVRLLNRAGFGPCPGDVARVLSLGHEAYVERELKAASPEDLSLQVQLGRLDVLQLGAIDLEDIPKEEVIRQLQQAAILRAVYGRNQLLERMADFWTNHFNVYALKGDAAFRKGVDEGEVIRSHALGKFPEMLRASSRSAAMLAYLDNPQNFKSHPNENYARELMELHTLGIGGGYTQRDVQEVARCFTGWSIENRFLRRRGTVRFDPDQHDDGQKLVLGHLIPAGGGEKDADQVLDILASHPSTARFLSRKLVRYFYGDEEPSLVAKVSSAYQTTGGDIPSMIRPILLSPLLASGPPVLKRPFHYLVSAIRAMGGETDGGSGIQEQLAGMGELLYEWPMPDGYPVKTAAWTGSMLPRWNFASSFARGSVGGTSAPKLEGDPFELTHSEHRASAAKELREALIGLSPVDGFALCLAAPSFQWS